jgi:TRAP-type transport system periplasmic protein
MKTSRRRFLLVAAGAAATRAQPAGAQPQTSTTRSVVMKLASPTLNDGTHEWMKRYAAAIEQRSGGRIKAELYPASQLGSIPRMIEGTQLGSIQMCFCPPEFLAALDPRYELLTAAGLFESEQHAVRTISDTEFVKDFLTLGANRGLVGAGLFLAGPAAFVMRSPFRTLADIRGKKIRVLASPFQTEQVARLGATGLSMSLGDVLPALQQGTIDGALGTVGVFAAFGYYDTARYLNETGHAFTFVMASVSKRWFDTLPADLRALVLTTARDMDKEVNPWVMEFDQRERRVWVEKGGEIDTLSASDKMELMARTGTIGDDIVKIKPELKPLWDELRAAVKRNA